MPKQISAVSVSVESPRSPDAFRLIDALSAEIRRRYDNVDDGTAGFSPADVEGDRGGFFVARTADGVAIGCVALRPYSGEVGEVKRMYVADDWRGCGIGGQLLVTLENFAAAKGYRRLILETGLPQPEAMHVYERQGYARIPGYGKYADDPLCVCFAKDLP